MNTKKRISAATLLAAASLTFSPVAWSLGLGDITVESFLNEPLNVKIDLISRETDDMATVTARLASADDYELIGASRESIPVPVRFSVEDPEGDAYIVATSTLPMANPIVRLIVEVNWSKGRLLREYTVFLDPPTYSEAAPIPRVDERKAPPPAVTTAPAAVPTQAKSSEPAPVAKPAAASPAPREPSENEYGPVSSGQTLWGIASDWSRGTGLEINKVMIAIQRENPSAFLKDNINLLKRGAILRMPKADDVRAISTATANGEVTAQSDAFRGRSTAGPATSANTPLLAEETAAYEEVEEAEEPREEVVAEEADLSPSLDAEQAEEQVEEQTVDPVETLAEEETQPQDQLELVPPSAASDLDSAYGFEESADANPDASITVSTLREDLTLKEEELIAQQQQNEYMAERIKELETELATAREATVEDADLSSMQDRLSEQRQAEEAAAAKSKKEPWYNKYGAWLIGLLVLLAGGIGWVLSRRGDSDEIISVAGSGDRQIRDIKDEAEEVLRVLEESNEAEAPAETEAEDDDKADSEAKTEPDAVEKPAEKAPETGKFGSGDEAELLDEESSDPEIQLDLARAYISMGDREAARVILQEVGNNGSESQQEEAKKMLNQLIP